MLRVFLLAMLACGGGRARPVSTAAPARPVTGADRMLPLLPEGAQVVVELDLQRLRHNAVVGDIATHALARLGADVRIPGLPVVAQGSPLAAADTAVLAAYGVGTAQAATIMLLQTSAELEGAVHLAPDLVALGPEDWISQVQTRAEIAAAHGEGLHGPAEIERLRDHAMPAGAPGAVLRITARLPFDARVALARQTGLESTPAQLSIWADVADDLAIVIDADAADPGDQGKDATRRLAAVIRSALGALGDEPTIRALGVSTSLADARLISQGSWVRAIIAVGPQHLTRAVERARAMLGPS